MQEVQQYPAGTFAWAELYTHDVAAAQAFYHTLFGWEIHESPVGPDMTYTMLKLHGKDVAGLAALRPDQQAQRVPSHWLAHIAVDDIAAAAQRVRELGGTVLAAPFAVLEAGHMAVVQDPQGAVFALWQAGSHIGSTVVNMPNTITWNELATTDTAAAETFYHGLFGWTAETDANPGGGGDYTMFRNGARPAGGMLAITPEMGTIVPNWAIYFGVADLNATIERAQAAGGNVLVPAMSLGEMGSLAVLSDPTGAVFTVMQATYYDPPPGY